MTETQHILAFRIQLMVDPLAPPGRRDPEIVLPGKGLGRG
jgi:hypothetical protein